MIYFLYWVLALALAWTISLILWISILKILGYLSDLISKGD